MVRVVLEEELNASLLKPEGFRHRERLLKPAQIRAIGQATEDAFDRDHLHFGGDEAGGAARWAGEGVKGGIDSMRGVEHVRASKKPETYSCLRM